MSWAEKAGYEHYEISNFAKPGFRSRHNFFLIGLGKNISASVLQRIRLTQGKTMEYFKQYYLYRFH
jgi:hypothetical protein